MNKRYVLWREQIPFFAGDKLLTTPNPSFEEDDAMFQLLGLKPRVAFKNEKELAEEVLSV